MGLSNIKYLHVIKKVVLKDHHGIILNSVAEYSKGAKNYPRVHFSGMEVSVFFGLLRKIKKPCAE